MPASNFLRTLSLPLAVFVGMAGCAKTPAPPVAVSHEEIEPPLLLPSPIPPVDSSLPPSAQIAQKLAAIERESTRLRASGEREQADHLLQQVAFFRVRVAGKAIADDEMRNQPQVHVIGMYEAAYADNVGHAGNNHPVGMACVELQDTDRPMILVLCAYEPIQWELRIAPGVKLQKIILSGYEDQTLANPVEEGTKVEKFILKQGGAADYFYAYKKDTDEYVRLQRRIESLTGQSVATFAGMYQYKGEPFLIGPRNAEWQLERILAEINLVYLEATACERAVFRKAIESIRFQAIYWNPTGRMSAVGSFATFSPLGPIEKTMVPFQGSKLAAIDPRGPMTYVISGESLVRFDEQFNIDKTISVDPALPKLSNPCGIAFDSKRNRIVLTSLGGIGYIYAYEIDQDKWSLLGDMGNVDLQSFTYSPEEDCFYGLAQPHDAPLTIYRYNANGALSQTIALRGAHLPSDRMMMHIAPMQLAFSNGKFTIVCPPSVDDSGENISPAICHIADAATGRIIFSQEMSPWTPAKEIAPAELDSLLTLLHESDDSQGVQSVIGELASDRKNTILALRTKLRSLPLQQDSVRHLMEQLNVDSWAQRNRAAAGLGRLGPRLAPQLKEILEGDLPPETRQRLATIVRDLELIQSTTDLGKVDGLLMNDPDLRLRIRAVRVLMRMGTPEAAEMLRKMAANPGTPIDERAAKEALRKF